jgi:hypothetical protein
MYTNEYISTPIPCPTQANDAKAHSVAEGSKKASTIKASSVAEMPRRSLRGFAATFA